MVCDLIIALQFAVLAHIGQPEIDGILGMQTNHTIHVRGCTRCSTGTVHEMADGHWSAPCLIRLCTGEPSARPSVPCKHDLRIAYSDAVGSCYRLCQVHMRKQLSTATLHQAAAQGLHCRVRTCARHSAATEQSPANDTTMHRLSRNEGAHGLLRVRAFSEELLCSAPHRSAISTSLTCTVM